MYKYYIRLDADSIGDRIEYYLLCDDWKMANEVHENIQNSMFSLKDFISTQEEYELLMTGCDDFLIGTNVSDILKIVSFADIIREQFYKLSNETLSAGIGNSVVEALMNLRKAKTAGKNRIIK